MKTLNPIKFKAGDSLDPRRINTAMATIYDSAKRLLDQKYSYFQFVVDLGQVTPSSNSQQLIREVEAPFKYEIISADFYTQTSDLASEDFILGCDATGFSDVTNSSDGYNTQSLATEIQNIRVAANTKITFSLAVPSTVSLEQCYGIIKCRVNQLEGLTLTAPTEIETGDTTTDGYQTINTWLSTINTEIGVIGSAWDNKPCIQMSSWTNYITYGTVSASYLTSTPQLYLLNNNRDILGISCGCYTSDKGTCTNLAVYIFDTMDSNNVLYSPSGAPANNTHVGFKDLSTETPPYNASTAFRYVLTPQQTGALVALELLYTVIYWQ